MAVKWLEYKTGKSVDAILSEKTNLNVGTFSDTTDPDILAAYKLGITAGETAPTAAAPGLFDPNGQFTRQQAAAMIRNIYINALGSKDDNVADAGFADIGTADAWARDGINFCNNNGIMSGTNENPKTFSPKDLYTREMSIATFNRMN